MNDILLDNLSEDAPIRRVLDYPTLLAEIRGRPALWLGSKSITALEHQLTGFELAEQVHRIEPQNRFSGFGFSGFEEWVEVQFNPRKLAIKSFHLARNAKQSEAEAFDLWFEWHDRFLEEGSG